MSRMLAAFGEAGEGGARPPLPAAAVPVSTRASVTLRTKADRRTGGGILRGVLERTRVELPAGGGGRFEGFVNGGGQQAGRDFRRQGGELVFDPAVAREGGLGLLRLAP